MLGDAMDEHGIGERLDDPEAIDPPRHPDRKAFAGELVDQGQRPDAPTIVGLSRYEVIAPDMPSALRSEPNARSVIQPEAAPWTLLLGYFQALSAPDALHTVPADIPSRGAEQGGEPAIAVPAVPRSEGDDSPGERIFVSTSGGDIALSTPRLADEPAGVTFRELILLLDAPYRLPPPVGPYKFPEAISLSTCFSSDRSATRRFSRAFSRSSSFIRLA